MDRIYHYTDRYSAADIRRDGVIRARAQTLHADMLARDRGVDTVPLIWFTARSDYDPTTAVKMRGGGWSEPPVGDLYRFALPADYAGASAFPPPGEPAAGCAAEWWHWVIATAMMVGDSPADWRLAFADVPLADVVAIEVLTSVGEDLDWGPA